MSRPGTTPPPLRVGNASGFYGDRFSAVQEMIEGGPLDVLTGDYLAELTMLILGRARLRNPDAGYATTFLKQMEQCLGLALDRGVRIVANAGGLNPAGLARELRTLAERLGLAPRIAHVEGDDLLPRAEPLGLGGPLTANAYLGGWGIAACLEAGADIVVTGRVTDASLVLGPAAAHFGWARDDWDALAGATVAGHILECGAQATGGNYSFFQEHDVRRPGFPLAEIHADGSSVISKHPGTGGAVTVGTVTAQLLYEIAGPRYPGPDVTTRFDTVRLDPDGPDRVRVHSVHGEPPPPDLKVCLNHLGGYRNETVFVLTGLAVEEKAELVREQVETALAARPPKELRWSLTRTGRPDADVEEEAAALLRCTVKDPDQKVVGRAFSGAAIELALAGYPGFHVTAPPGDASPYGVYTAAYVEAGAVEHTAVLPDGTRRTIAPAALTRRLDEPAAQPAEPAEPAEPLAPTGTAPDAMASATAVPTAEGGPTRLVPLGTLVGARSGDKGGTANVGVWARTDEAWHWLERSLTVDQFRSLLPETARLPVRRHAFPALRALNFVVDGLLGEGVSSTTRFDPQAKAVGEWLRARPVDIPAALLPATGNDGTEEAR
ncbi:acyclic terpene utilization AtuA family protein [Streptacidiphilus sp. EB129]|uniref:acyclic terpene utilization AtuA family protein n=1 Tax=Streptacidiphilus sp. EB129 TaxID=3156262 RepID=UPI003511482C